MTFSPNKRLFLARAALGMACISVGLGATNPARAQKPPTQNTPPALYAASAAAEAAREDGETLYEGVVAEPVKNGNLVLSVERIVPPNGKTQIVSPARRKTVRLSGDVILRAADASGFEMTQVDLVPGARVFVLGAQPAKAGAKASDALTARVILVSLDGSEMLPGSLLKPWNLPANWTFRSNANSAPGSLFEADTGALHLKIGGTPVKEWHAQIFQQMLAGTDGIVPGKPYTLRFLARTDTNHFVTIGSQADTDATYKNMGLLQTVLLTPRWQVFQYTFTSAPNASGPIRLPVFSAAHRGGDVFLANVSLAPGALPLPNALQAERDKQAAPNINLIDHANEADAWLIYTESGAKGTLAQANEPGGGNVLKVTVDNPSSQAYHFQLLRPALPLIEGRTYELRFLAKANRKRTLDVEGQATVGDFHNIGLSKIVDLDTAWKEYTVRFTAKNVVENNSHAPQFCFAQEAGTVWLANISLKLLP